MNRKLHNLFPIPVWQGHLDPPEGLHEMLQEKYKQCNKAVWALESNLSTGELGMDLMICLLYTSPSPRDLSTSRMPSSA